MSDPLPPIYYRIRFLGHPVTGCFPAANPWRPRVAFHGILFKMADLHWVEQDW
jgi:hypothetical protein